MSCQIRKMKMMAAASCEPRAPETACGKEVASNLQKMMAERSRQDSMWSAPAPAAEKQEQPIQQYSSSFYKNNNHGK